jgi:hypothetical protein
VYRLDSAEEADDLCYDYDGAFPVYAVSDGRRDIYVPVDDEKALVDALFRAHWGDYETPEVVEIDDEEDEDLCRRAEGNTWYLMRR